MIRRSCRRCGWSGTYDSTGRGDYAKRQHSCEKWTAKIAGQERNAARLASVDRTPKACTHKIANHQHGTRACYVLDACRCLPCSSANSAAETGRERQKVYGRYDKFVAAEDVRAHLRVLGDYGIGLKRVAKLSGVSTGTLSKIMYGVYAPITGPHQGCKGSGDRVRVREPSRRVLRSTAEKIYAIDAVPANLGSGQADHDRTPTARLHLRALVALGWSQSKLATRLGMLPTNLGPVIGTSTQGGPRRRDGLRVLSRSTVDAIEALYDELSMTLPPETNQRERIAASRARNYAKALGWLPPLALDEDDDTTADDLQADADIDHAAVIRRLNGDRSVRLNRAEAAEVYRHAIARGMNTRQMERDLGIKPERYTQKKVAS